MRLLYSILFLLMLPLLLLSFIKRGFKNRLYWRRWSEFFARYSVPSGKYIWIHAASMGELQAALPLLDRLMVRYPDVPVLISNTSPTGSAEVQKQLGDRVQNVLLPFDLPWLVNRFLKRFNPRIAIVMETEIWPNLFHACVQREINIVMANARLSDKSVSRYRRLAWLSLPALHGVSLIACQSKTDQQRFEQIGVPEGLLQNLGNLKFDVELPENSQDKASERRRQLGEQRLVWVAASTRDGEEEMILQAFAHIAPSHPDLLLVLVPRHPERFETVATMLESGKLSYQRFSANEACSKDTQVFLLDAMGQLQAYYGVAEIVFVGGSLVPIGGHNPLEPALWGKPIITGPHVSHFVDIHVVLENADAEVMVTDADSLESTVRELIASPARRHELGRNAEAVMSANQGAADRLLEAIEHRISIDAQSLLE